jgi:hypothetical protein
LTVAHAGCISPEQARAKIGGTACVRAKVLKIIQGADGGQYLGFCADQAKCPFTVAVPANDLRDVGDVRTLVGKTVEVHGPVREADGRAEMVLRDTRQLRGEAAKLPAVPKAYDVEQRGHYRASVPRPPKAAKKKRGRRPPRTLPPGGMEIPADKEE